MRAYTLRFLGIPIWTLEVMDWETETPVEAEVEDEGTPTEVGGGSSHNFALDEAPFAPEDQFAGEWSEDRRVKLGFQATRTRPDVPGTR